MRTSQRSCTVEGCPRTVHARDWCQTHYVRWKRLGTVNLTPRQTAVCTDQGCDRPSLAKSLCERHYAASRRDPLPTLAERFAANHEPGEGGCWIWKNSPAGNGYGRISVNNTLQYAHRVSYELHIGPIPDGLTIDHLCRVQMCVNPAHLEPVTLAENTRRELAVRWAS